MRRAGCYEVDDRVIGARIERRYDRRPIRCVVLRRLRPRATVGELVRWPRDGFALATLALDHTESYRFTVAPPPGRSWPPLPDWEERVRSAARGWRTAATHDAALPGFVERFWRTLTRYRHTDVALSGAAAHGRKAARSRARGPYDAPVLDPKVFKAYDVRGIHPSELDEEGAYAIGRAYVEQFEPRTVAVGRDMRLAAPAMASAVIDGAADGGADVLDLGMVGTEMVYYAVGDLGLDGGICVTASHNPKEYTGMKIVRGGALPVGGDSGLDDVRRRAGAGFGPVTRRGAVEALDVWPGFVTKVLSFVDRATIRPLRVVVDAANGMAGAMLPPVLAELPQLDVVTCHFEPDGSFPNHEPNPLLPENRAFIVERTRAEGADLGVAYDGDADRCFFVDDTGEFVPGDFVTTLLAEAMLEREPGAKIIYDVRASWAVPHAIQAAGGVPLVNRVGHAFIKHRMRDEDAAFGGEVSAHYYYRDFSQADTGVVPFLVMLELLSRRGRPLSEILAPLRSRYFITGEINTPVADVDLKLREIEERYAAAGGSISHLDGVSVDFEDWHCNVRPSNTEPLLRLNLEALSQDLMEERRDELLALIRA